MVMTISTVMTAIEEVITGRPLHGSLLETEVLLKTKDSVKADCSIEKDQILSLTSQGQ